MLHEAIRYVVIGLLMWFMVATVLLLLITMDARNRNRTPRITTIVALLPAVLMLHLCRGVERVLSRILYADDPDATSTHQAASTRKE